MQASLFDLENRYASLSEAGDPLERLNAVIDWDIFRSILQRLHNLSDDRLQYQVTDRLSFMRFLGLDLAADVPDARTVWAFREALRTHQP